MKLKRFIVFLISVVILISSFCFSVSAEGSISTKMYLSSRLSTSNYLIPEFVISSPIESKTGSFTISASDILNYDVSIQHCIRLDPGADLLFSKGDQGYLNISGIKTSVSYYVPEFDFSGTIPKPTRYRLRYKYVDNSYSDYLDLDFTLSWNGNVLSIDIPIDCVKDVLEVQLFIIYTFSSLPDPTGDVDLYSELGVSSIKLSGHIDSEDKGLLATIVSWLRNMASRLVTVVNNLFSIISRLDILDYIRNSIDNIFNFIKSIPEFIIYGIRSIFIPDPDALKADLSGLIERLNHTFNLTIDSADWLKDSFTEEAIPDVREFYNIPGVGNMELPFFNTKFLKRGIEYFRPIIRGFIVLLLCFFHYKQALTFIGQDPGIYSSAVNDVKEKLNKEG